MKNPQRNPYRQLLTAALLVGGTFQIASSVLAQTAPTPTSANTSISNTATATYNDAGNPTGPALNSTSNTVTITVAEIAGLYINNSGVVDGTPATTGIQANDTIYFDFDVTNVGNDPTTIVIPNLATIAGSGTISGPLQVESSPGVYTPIPAGSTSGQVQPGASVRVRVPVLVGSVSTGTISVTLGDTTPSAAQNVPYLNTPGSVYTQDNNALTGGTPVAEATGTAPANGEREASIIQSATINATDLAFATVLKTVTSYSQNSTPLVTNDDLLTYGLSLRVEGSPPSASSTAYNAARLTGTILSGGVDGNVTNRFILISDAIPVGTSLNATPVAPTGWRAVYSSTPTATPANQAVWTLTAPTYPATTLTRVGFIYDPDLNLATDSPAIAPNTTVTGFSFLVRTTIAFSATGTTGGQIANIAQAFGTSNGGTALVYDESGDQTPSNFTDAGIPGSSTPTTGVAVPGTDGTDPGNNAGTDTTASPFGGEDTIYNIPAPGVSAVLLGPEGAAGAIGPTNNNDDFTNRAASFPTADTPLNTDTTNPDPIAFVNTVQNNGTVPASISIIPTTPANLGFADLPTGTLVQISATGVSGSKFYVWNGANFVFDADGNPGTPGDQSPIDTALEVLTIPNIPANGGTSAYNISIDLPPGTTLSTDLVSLETADPEYGYPVPVTAFVDTNGNGIIDGAEVSNTSIDRVYVGFLRLLKESRLVPGFGPAFPAGQEVFSVAPRTPAPGNRVEYQITYTNISSVPATGSGSLGLNANNIVITENGTVLPNNWGRDNDVSGTPGFGQIDTLNVVGTAIESGGAVPSYFNGTAGTAPSSDVVDVTGYTVNTGATLLGPSQFRTFKFQREIDQ